MSSEFPPISAGHTLRITQRALRDLGLKDVAPNDIETIRERTLDRDFIDKFIEQRSEYPSGTAGPMRNVGRHDIYSLHGRDGLRGATWYDPEISVCWLLGVARQHRYDIFDERATEGTLLPTEDDFAIYFEEAESFEEQIKPGLRVLILAAFASPWTPQRATLGNLLRAEVSVVAEPVESSYLADKYFSVQVPPLNRGVLEPLGWPGKDLLARLAELALDADFDELDCVYPHELPHGVERWRKIDRAREIALMIRNVESINTE